MADTTNKRQPRPWHTASFYNARFAMLCIGCISTYSLGHLSFGISFLSILAFFDALGITAWKRNEIFLPAPLTDGSAQSVEQVRLLKTSIAAFVVGFCGVLVVAFGFARAHNSEDKIIRVIVFLLANYAGWQLLRWLREAITLMKQYRAGSIFNTTKSVTSSTVSPSVYCQPAPQTYSQKLLAGSGMRP